MPNGKRGKKSYSLNDIPVGNRTKDIISSLDDGDFCELLNRVSQPQYTRGSSSCLTLHSERNTGLAEPNNLIQVCEKNLRDEDAAREEEQQRQERKLNRNPTQALAFSRSPSPPERTSAGTTSVVNKAIDFDAIKMDFIDDGDGDVEMTDLGRTRTAKTFTRGNRECIAMEYSDADQSNISVPELGGLSQENDAQIEQWKVPSLGGTPPSEHRSLIRASEGKKVAGDNFLLVGCKEKHRHPLINVIAGEATVDLAKRRQLELMEEGEWRPDRAQEMEEMERYMVPLKAIEEADGGRRKDWKNIGDGVRNYDKNTIELPLPAPLVNTKVEEKKRKRNKKIKDNKNTYNVEDNPEYMGRLPVDELVLLIEGKTTDTVKTKKSVTDDDASRKEKRRKSKEKKEEPSPATIGNQGSIQAADSVEEPPQPVQATPLSSKAKSKASVVAKVQKSKKEVETCRGSVDDQEEEFISADEGVVSSNSDELVATHVPASEVMLDGANYRADTDDLSNIDNQVTEEQEFITVGARPKKKNLTHPQTVRTGSTGKVVPAATTTQSQQRRNSVEERPKGGVRRPPTASFAEYVEERRTETRAHAKAVPFKSKNKHERLESDDVYPEVVGDETMVRMAESENGSTSSPEKTFSYADAAKKSSDPSRENSPTAAASLTPSPPPSTAEASLDTTPIVSSPESASTAAAVPVSMPSAKNADTSSGEISFFYDENEAKPEAAAASTETAEASEGDGAFVLNLGGKTVRFAKGMAAPAIEQPLDHHQRLMLDILRKNWEDFHRGNAPVVYTPGM